jgi:hypothetical protein
MCEVELRPLPLSQHRFALGRPPKSQAGWRVADRGTQCDAEERVCRAVAGAVFGPAEAACLGLLLPIQDPIPDLAMRGAAGFVERQQDDLVRRDGGRQREHGALLVALARVDGPGVGTDQIAKLWPKAGEFGFANEMAAFGLQFGHGLGLGLHERPIISRLNSIENPVEIKEGMVFALETYCPASDGFSAARIEEEVVVTSKGVEVLTRFPAQELFVANPY